MPRKLRQLRADLKKHGFQRMKDRGKGDHEVWRHSTGVTVGLDGKDGRDARAYQEKEVREAIEQAQRGTP
jgi:predicted RNA binding protein YcfA (HicA-like mRNA interferase family)